MNVSRGYDIYLHLYMLLSIFSGYDTWSDPPGDVDESMPRSSPGAESENKEQRLPFSRCS